MDSPDDDSVTGYKIWRSLGPPKEGENTWQLYVDGTGSTATTYTDTNALAGERYGYYVRATNTSRTSKSSNRAYADLRGDNGQTTEPQQPPSPDPPRPPRNLTAVANDDGSITLFWEAPDLALMDEAVTGYQILRRRPKEGEYILLTYVKNTGTTATTYIDTNTRAGTRYVYSVKAITTTRLTEPSNYIKVTSLGPEETAEQLSGHWCADHQRDGAGGRDADDGHLRRRRRGRPGQRFLRLPLDCHRREHGRGHPGRDQFDLHPVLRRPRQDHQGACELRRRRGQR